MLEVWKCVCLKSGSVPVGGLEGYMLEVWNTCLKSVSAHA